MPGTLRMPPYLRAGLPCLTPSDLASLSASQQPEHTNVPLPSPSTDAAVKLAAHAHFRSSFSWKVSVAWRVFLPWGG